MTESSGSYPRSHIPIVLIFVGIRLYRGSVFCPAPGNAPKGPNHNSVEPPIFPSPVSYIRAVPRHSSYDVTSRRLDSTHFSGVESTVTDVTSRRLDSTHLSGVESTLTRLTSQIDSTQLFRTSYK